MAKSKCSRRRCDDSSDSDSDACPSTCPVPPTPPCPPVTGEKVVSSIKPFKSAHLDVNIRGFTPASGLTPAQVIGTPGPQPTVVGDLSAFTFGLPKIKVCVPLGTNETIKSVVVSLGPIQAFRSDNFLLQNAPASLAPYAPTLDAALSESAYGSFHVSPYFAVGTFVEISPDRKSFYVYIPSLLQKAGDFQGRPTWTPAVDAAGLAKLFDRCVGSINWHATVV